MINQALHGSRPIIKNIQKNLKYDLSCKNSWGILLMFLGFEIILDIMKSVKRLGFVRHSSVLALNSKNGLQINYFIYLKDRIK